MRDDGWGKSGEGKQDVDQPWTCPGNDINSLSVVVLALALAEPESAELIHFASPR